MTSHRSIVAHLKDWLILIALLLHAASIGAEDCDGFLKNGVFNKVKSESSNSSESKLKRYLMSESFHEWAAKQSAGFNILIPTETGPPIPFGAQEASSNWDQFKAKVEALDERELRLHETSAVLKQFASKELLDSYLECLRLKNREIVGESICTANAVSVYLRWVPVSSDDKAPVIESFDFDGGTIKENRLKPGTRIDVSGITQIIYRTNTPIMFSLNTSRGQWHTIFDGAETKEVKMIITRDNSSLKPIFDKWRTNAATIVTRLKNKPSSPQLQSDLLVEQRKVAGVTDLLWSHWQVVDIQEKKKQNPADPVITQELEEVIRIKAECLKSLACQLDDPDIVRILSALSESK